MKAIVKFSQRVTLEIEEHEEMETLHRAIILSSPRKVCNICNDPEKPKHFTSNKDKEGNIYVNLKCACGARSKLGQLKAGGYFWHDFEVYEPKATEGQPK